MNNRLNALRISLGIVFIVLFSTIAGIAQNTVLAPTPPMGWNSWNAFEAKINEQLIKETADAMVNSGMRDAGYEFLVLDDGWMAADRDAQGNLQADPEKFPNGMKAIGDYIHSKGLKFGIYECRGYLTCQKLPGSFEHEVQDMAIFASWGVDYIKLDACYAEKNGRLTTDDLQIYHDAIAKTGRPMILSISDFGNGAWAWGGKNYGQLWRTSYDIYPWIENVYHHAETSGGNLRIHPAFNGLWQFAGPGHWNDPDMLEIGNLKSESEDRVHMSLWCMLAAPLMAGNDLRNMPEAVRNVLTAREVIAVNQDPRGHQGYKVFDNGKQVVYNKPLSDGTTAILLFNMDSIPADITVRWDQVGLSGKQKVRDLWAEKNLGTVRDFFTARQVPQHGQYLLKVGKPGSAPIEGPVPVPAEKYTPANTGYTFLSDIYYLMKYGEAPGYDTSLKGQPIRMKEITYDKGLSCEDGSILIYKLAGNGTRFRALVGLDDSYTGSGTGRFRVLNEDAFGNKVLYDSGLMTKDSLPKQIDIDVKGLDCLFLKFDGKDALGDWALARVMATWDEQKVSYDIKYVDSLIAKMELIPIRVNGDKNNRINIVIINRWEKRDARPYKGPELRAEFLDDINRSLLAAFTPGNPAAQTAYANYQQFFNLYALWWPDVPEWKTGDMDTDLVDAIRDRLFLPWTDRYTGWVTILMMPNRDGGGGGAARNLEERTGNAVIVGNGIGKMLHEISHTCTSIGDEYTAGATGITPNPAYTTSLEYERDNIRWRAWVDPSTPLPTPYTAEYLDKIGAFEGSQYHLTNYFRSSAQGCIMGAGVFDNTEKMCSVCEQRLSMRVYTLVFPIEKAIPGAGVLTVIGQSTQHFSVSRVHPEPDTQQTKWILNGKTIATGVDEVNVTFAANTDNELVFSLTDTTNLIRDDPPYGEHPCRELRWNIQAGPGYSEQNSGVISGKPVAVNIDPVGIRAEIWASEKGKNNGRITLDTSRASGDRNYLWSDHQVEYGPLVRYEAENADIGGPGVRPESYFGASKQLFVHFAGSTGSISWVLEVERAGKYPVSFVYASSTKGDVSMRVSVNGGQVEDSLLFPESRPLFTGWDRVSLSLNLKKGKNRIELVTKGHAGPNFDYLAIPQWVVETPVAERDRCNLAPGIYSVVITDAPNSSREMTFEIREADPFTLDPVEFRQDQSGKVKIRRPDPLMDYFWYRHDAPVFIGEKAELPAGYGTSFRPEQKGNFFLAARKKSSGVESANRIGVYIDPERASMTGAVISPDQVKSANLLLWLDASDLNADGKADNPAPERGPNEDWKDKVTGMKGPFILFKPNSLNNRGVAGFDNVWVTGLEKPLTGFQTIFMVYKESSVSFTGTSPFKGVSEYMGKAEDSESRFFSDSVSVFTRKGKVYLDGVLIDPLKTPNPMDYCLLTLELASRSGNQIKGTEGYWEGSLAEILLYDGILGESERKAVEAGLRKKWFTPGT